MDATRMTITTRRWVAGRRTVGINLDATYAYDEMELSAYVSWQNSERNLNAVLLALCC